MFAKLAILEQLASGFVKYRKGPILKEGGRVSAAGGGAR